MTERLNQTLSRSLTKLVNKEQTNWDEKLETVLSAYRVSKQKSTGYSPFFMMFHRQPLLPIDSELLQKVQDGESDVEAFIDNMMLIREDVKEAASLTIAKSQSAQKKYYDSRHSTEVFIFNYCFNFTMLYLLFKYYI